MVVLLLALTWMVAGCTSVPSWDRRIGAEVAQEIAASMGLVDDPALTGYVDQIGQRLAAQLDRPVFEYKFHVVDQEVPNAFALPGGYVYVTRGLLALTNSEDELANTLSHEIAHVDARHAAQRYRAAVLPTLAVLPGAIVGSVVDEGLGQLIASPFQWAGTTFLASYSRDQERHADRLGQKLAAKAGFDPAAMSSCLLSIGRFERLEKQAQKLPSHLQTHPDTKERVVTTAQHAKTLVTMSSLHGAGDRADYLKRISGLVTGKNPARGLFGGRTFSHPDLGVAMDLPSGWVHARTPQAIGAMSPKRDGLIFASVPTKGQDPAAAAKPFLEVLQSRLRVPVTQSNSTQIDGLPAYTASARGGSSRTPIGLEMLWVSHDGLMYRIMGLTSTLPDRDHTSELRQVLSSFHKLTESQRSSFKVHRVNIVRAREGETLKQLSHRSENQWALDHLAAMNGMSYDVRLRKGQLIKVAIAKQYSPGPWWRKELKS